MRTHPFLVEQPSNPPAQTRSGQPRMWPFKGAVVLKSVVHTPGSAGASQFAIGKHRGLNSASGPALWGSPVWPQGTLGSVGCQEVLPPNHRCHRSARRCFRARLRILISYEVAQPDNDRLSEGAKPFPPMALS